MARSIRRLVLVGALALAIWGKHRHKNARLIALLKRLLTFIASRIVPVARPRLLTGPNKTSELGRLLQELGSKKPLVVTDRVLIDSGIVAPVNKALSSCGLSFETYEGVLPNPHVELVEEAEALFRQGSCDGLVAVGGGSAMDLAKVVGARICNAKSIKAYHGAFTVTTLGLRKLPPMVAVPTTAGTGSECTVAAVISVPKEESKIIIMDLGFIPPVAVLDPMLLLQLPPVVTAATGMDALTHAIESYLSGIRSSETAKWSLEAVQKIYQSLQKSYKDGKDVDAREQMLTASHLAGLAFTRANVGNVHAIAHQLGAIFHTPHGIANAMLLPHVLEYYLDGEEGEGASYCADMYCELAVAAGLSAGKPTDLKMKRDLARQFVVSIVEMAEAMSLPTSIPELTQARVAEVAQRALNETDGCSQGTSNPIKYLLELGYQPPRYMSLSECEEIISKLLPSSA
mmetsp:Transcript_68642/g.128042  ORF Transcript_68642/g.128042 Transcript_68642/m.128042 type:complete len:458 (-) Transcript_68642:73-1446(-)